MDLIPEFLELVFTSTISRSFKLDSDREERERFERLDEITKLWQNWKPSVEAKSEFSKRYQEELSKYQNRIHSVVNQEVNELFLEGENRGPEIPTLRKRRRLDVTNN